MIVIGRYTRRLALVVVAVTAAGLAACSSSPPAPRLTLPSATPSATATGGSVPLDETGPVPAPNHGALVGAWVKPLGSITQTSRVTAINGLQQAIGRNLDIVHTYRRMTDAFPMPSDYQLTADGSTLMVSWATGDTREITSGKDDAQITAWAQRFKSFPHPILLRMRWEMDRPNLRATMWSGADFVAAWKHVRSLFDAQHVTNVSWVWCPTSTGFAAGTANAFYPGDDQVDWVCVDVYSASKYQPLAQLMAPFLAWAGGHPKPIIVGEFGVADAYSPQQRSTWLAGAAQVFQGDPQIKAVCYFDSDPDGAVAQQSFALPSGSAEISAFATLARTPYFNPHNVKLSATP
jgi:hypothetical protein